MMFFGGFRVLKFVCSSCFVGVSRGFPWFHFGFLRVSGVFLWFSHR